MAAPKERSRPAALDEFSTALRKLRERAGQPSFRRMAARSGAVSHATLHLTVTGHRLQPWETVREFVRACDGDEAEWQQRWERTRAALSGETDAPADGGNHSPERAGADAECGTDSDSYDRADGEPAHGGPADDPHRRTEDDSGRDDTTDRDAGETPVTRTRRRWPRSRRLGIPLGVGLAVVVTVASVWLLPGEDEPAAESRYGGAVNRGDSSEFVADVTIPDGTVVRPNQEFVKTWKLRNTGSVHWRDRYLRRIDMPMGPDDCQTPDRVPINDTAPRQEVSISVDVRASPSAPVDCKVHWKMVDGSGNVLLPGYRPIYFEVRVRTG